MASEQDLVQQVEEMVADFRPSEGVSDSWSWVPNPTEGFTVKSYYSTLVGVGDDTRTTT